MDIGVMHDVMTAMAGALPSLDWSHPLSGTGILDWGAWGHSSFDLAQINRVLEDNLFSNIQKSFNHFVKTGQVWAFIIGLALGYIFRSFTSYG
jgi:hypothetical protein